MSSVRAKVQEVKDLLGGEQKCALKECACFEGTSSAAGKMRDKVDQCVVNMFNEKKWDKSKPIHLVDIIAGDLLQTATVVKSLVDAGYKVNISIIGATQKLEEQFGVFLGKLNAEHSDSAVLGGSFSNMDSYLSVVHGQGALKFTQVALEDRDKRISEAKSPSDSYRYVRSTPDEGTFKLLYGSKNLRYETEYDEAERIRGKSPDLVLCVDDITEYASGLHRIDARRHQGVAPEVGYHVSSVVDKDYFFQQDVIEPLKKFASKATILGTDKNDGQISLVEYPNPGSAKKTVETMLLGERPGVQKLPGSSASIMGVLSVGKPVAAPVPAPASTPEPSPQDLVTQFMLAAENKNKERDGKSADYFSKLDVNLLIQEFEKKNMSLRDIKKCASYALVVKLPSQQNDLLGGLVKNLLTEQRVIKDAVVGIKVQLQILAGSQMARMFHSEERINNIRDILKNVTNVAAGDSIQATREALTVLQHLKLEIEQSKDLGMKKEMTAIKGILDKLPHPAVDEAKDKKQDVRCGPGR